MIDKGRVGRPRRPVAAEAIREHADRGLSFRQIAREPGFGYDRGSINTRGESYR
jgi:hypothetical protein